MGLSHPATDTPSTAYSRVPRHVMGRSPMRNSWRPIRCTGAECSELDAVAVRICHGGKPSTAADSREGSTRSDTESSDDVIVPSDFKVMQERSGYWLASRD
jgi:hypothetical protein